MRCVWNVGGGKVKVEGRRKAEAKRKEYSIIHYLAICYVKKEQREEKQPLLLMICLHIPTSPPAQMMTSKYTPNIRTNSAA